MAETGNILKATRKLVDPVFREGIPEMHDLYIYISEDELTCAVSDKNLRKFIALESWQLQDENLKPQLDRIRSESELLSVENYRKVICCSGFRKSTLVPGPLYESENAAKHLYFSHPQQAGEVIMTDEILQLEARNVFSVPGICYNAIQSWFRHVEMHHTSTSIIEYLLTTNRNKKDEIVTVYVHNSFIEIFVIKGRVLLMHNSFNYGTPEEFVYYVLFVCEQLHLNPDNVLVYFAGEIDKNSSLFQLSCRYIRHAEVVSRPEILDYSNVLAELPSPLHFNLFSQVICAL